MHAMTCAAETNGRPKQTGTREIEVAGGGSDGTENVRQGEDIANSSVGECLARIETKVAG